MSKEFAASGQLSAEQIEYIRNDDPGNYIDENDWNTLCDMALLSLTARNDGIEAAAKLADADGALQIRWFAEDIRKLKGGK